MKVDIRLTEEERRLVPDFETRLQDFQSSVDKMEKNRREKFRLILHEAGHAWADRKFFRETTLYGPNVTMKEGDLAFALGSVAASTLTLPGWMKGAVAVAGYLAVEILTGAPESPETIKHDNKGHTKSDLEMGEVFIRDELPESLQELLGVACEYEAAIFGTDEVVAWGVKEFRVFHPGERYEVGLSALGCYAVLIESDCTLSLYVDGARYTPSDKIRDYPLMLVKPGEPKREGADEVVQRWNEVVGVSESYIIAG